VLTPTAVAGSSTGVTDISGGDGQTCAVMDGGVTCWGGTYPNQPQAVFGLESGMTAVSTGGGTSCALTTAGATTCWGYNGEGEVGDGTLNDRAVPAVVPGLESGVDAVVVRGFHTCVLISAAVQCFGTDYEGELGDGGSLTSVVPLAVVGLGRGTAVPPSVPDSLVVTSDDTSTNLSWGAPADDGGAAVYGYAVTVLAADGGTATDVAAPRTRLTSITSFDFDGLTPGTSYRFEVTPLNPAGMGRALDSPGAPPETTTTTSTTTSTSTSTTTSIPADQTAPSISVSSPASSVRLSGSVPVAWSGSDPSGIAQFDVRLGTTAWNTLPGPRAMWLSGTAATSATFLGTYGRTYCFGARAQDNAGNLSGWSTSHCTAVPLRSDQLAYTSSFSKTTRSGAFAGFGYLSTTHGAQMKRTGIVATRLYLVATECATCGSVQVRWNGTLLSTINLYSPTTVRAQVVGIHTFSTAHTGTLTATVSSPTGKSVLIEGLAIYDA